MHGYLYVSCTYTHHVCPSVRAGHLQHLGCEQAYPPLQSLPWLVEPLPNEHVGLGELGVRQQLARYLALTLPVVVPVVVTVVPVVPVVPVLVVPVLYSGAGGASASHGGATVPVTVVPVPVVPASVPVLCGADGTSASHGGAQQWHITSRGTAQHHHSVGT